MPAELVQAEEVIKGEAVTTALMTICSKIWQTGEWPTPWTLSLVITLPKKGNLQLRQNYQMISLISHPSKVMLNRLKTQAEIITEEQAGFRAGKNTTEHIFNRRILCKKHLQQQLALYRICRHRFKKGLQQGLACSFVDNHEEVQHQHQPCPSHQTPL